MQNQAQLRPQYGSSNPKPGPDSDVRLRVAQVVELLPEHEAEYRRLHAEVYPAVLATLSRVGIRNYSIFLGEIGGQSVLFSYFEFEGEDYPAACAAIAACPDTQRWWQLTDPCQQRLPGTPAGRQWLPLERVFTHAGGQGG